MMNKYFNHRPIVLLRFGICMMIGLLFSIHAMAIDYEVPTQDRGYWNYELKPIKEDKNKDKNKTRAPIPNTPPPPPVLPTTKILMQMHPKQIQVLVKRWRGHAIHTLKPSDVSEALRVQDVARKKAASYAAVVGLINQTNPNLTLSDEIPITSAARQVKFNQRKSNMDAYLLAHNRQYGLLYFTADSCEFCRLQDSVLSRFLDTFGYHTKRIDFNKNPVMAQRFNIKQTPSILLIARGSKKWIPISFGVASLPQMKERIYRGIRFVKKEINPTQFFTNEIDIGTGLDPANQQQ